MNQTLNQLLETMDNEMRGYRDMQALLAEERVAASPSQKGRLEAVGQEKQALIQTIQQLEKKRQTVAGKLAAALGVTEPPLTVSKIASRLEEPHASRLMERAESMKSLIKVVQRENSANSKLIFHYLELVHGSLKLINDLIYTRSVYPKPGSERRGTGYGGARGKVFCGTI